MGMALYTHNLGEVVDAIIMMIDNPEVTTGELMNIIKGPDFPTGGIIMGRGGMKKLTKPAAEVLLSEQKLLLRP